jgi:hypothetical protein
VEIQVIAIKGGEVEGRSGERSSVDGRKLSDFCSETRVSPLRA